MQEEGDVLLATLGVSPMVLPEAWFLAPDTVRRVCVLTFSRLGTKLSEVRAFFKARGVSFEVSYVAELEDIRTDADHRRFEEVLSRWYLEIRAGLRRPPLVCLSGGRKTMAATLQKAATVLGAGEVFHVLAEGNPATIPAVEEAQARGDLHFVRMGGEPGWLPPDAQPARYPLVVETRETDRFLTLPPDGGATLRCRVGELMARWNSGNRGEEGVLERLPFGCLRMAPGTLLEWLRSPLEPEDVEWLRGLPKTDLHLHLGGFATHGEALAEVRAAALEPPAFWPTAPKPPPGWPEPEQRLPLEAYMALGDANGSKLLHDAGCLRAQVAGLYRHLVEEGVRYAEVRCSPANYARGGQTAWDILQFIQQYFEEAMAATVGADGRPFCQVNLIIIVTRKVSGDLSSISRHLGLAVTAAQRPAEWGRCRVVGVDLAGFENLETRPLLFQQDFQLAHRCGLSVTAHAGENDDAESIWQAVYQLSARRLGHALHLNQSADLLRAVVERGIGVEMCPYANYQILGFRPMPGGKADYPLLAYLRAGVKVSVNTDNPGISAAGLTENLAFLARLCPGITRLEVLQAVRNGLDTAFCPLSMRVELNRRFEEALQATF